MIVRLVPAGVLIVLCCMNDAGAAIVFDGGSPGYNPGGYTPGWNLTNAVVANDFEVTAPTLLTGVTFWTLEPDASSFDGTINWFLFLDSDHKPSSTAFAHGTGSQIFHNPNVLGYQYDFSLGVTVLLNANQRYWLGIDLNAGTTASSIYWVPPAGWLDPPQYSTFFGEVAKRTMTGTWDFTSWGSNYFDGAFRLSGRPVCDDGGGGHGGGHGRVPEPSALAVWSVLCIAGMGCGWWRKRKN